MVMATMMLIVMMMLAGRVAALGSLLGSGHGHVRPATADLGATHRPERRSSLQTAATRRRATSTRRPSAVRGRSCAEK